MMRPMAVLPALLLFASLASADDRSTITVHGRGTVRVRPDKLILVLGANGKAEKAADAVAKLDKKTKEIKDAMNALLKEKGQQNFAMKDSGLSFGSPVDQMQVMMGGQQEGANEITVSTDLEVSLAGIDKMEEAALADLISSLVDKAVETGAEVKAPNRYNMWAQQAGSNGVYFGFTDYAAQVEKAWDEAAAKAKARAASIARRLDLEIGSAVKIKDLTQGEGAQRAMNPYAMAWGMATEEEGPKIKTSGEVELAVDIEVEFELKKK